MGQIWNIGYITKQQAATMPDKTALIIEDVPITYKQLNQEVNRTAHYLQNLGLKKRDRVALFLMNCPEFVYLYFAIAKTGLIIVPLNTRLVGPELEYQINDCGAEALFFNSRFNSTIEKIMGHISVGKDKYVCIKEHSGDVKGCPEWALDFNARISDFPDTEPKLDEYVFLDDPLGILYTSGVTGDPKGAVVNHNQTFFKILSLSGTSIGGLVFLTQLPLFHSAGLFISLSMCIGQGAVMVFRRKFDPVQFCLDIEKYKANVVFALTTMWRLILDSGKLDEIDKGSVITAYGGGERTPKSLLERLKEKGIVIQVGFGQTENSAMMMLPLEDVDRKQGSVGKPREWTDIWIEDEQGNKLPPGKIGEIVAIGPKVMSGYWNKPELTAETIVNGVLHTGDLGYMDEEGYFYLVDRAKDMYRSGGENVYPAEIEKVLLGHPGIMNVAIIGVADDKWGETGKAFIQPVKGSTLTLEEIHLFLAGKVSKYKFPAYMEIMEQLPLTATGKTMKAALKTKHGVKLDE